MIELAGRVAIVTGAATAPGKPIGSGLGEGIARVFARAGARVVVHHRSAPAEADAVVAALRAEGAEAIAVRAELSTDEGAESLVAAAVDAFGTVDILVNNAAVQPIQPLETMTLDDWRAVVDANLAAVFATTQAAARRMAEAGGGSIVHIASIEGHHPAPAHAHYATAKAAVLMHARAAALEYGPKGVRVNTVSPGLVGHPGLAAAWPEGVARWTSKAPLGRVGTAEDIANACLFLASPLASWITGTDLIVDGGMTASPLW